MFAVDGPPVVVPGFYDRGGVQGPMQSHIVPGSSYQLHWAGDSGEQVVLLKMPRWQCFPMLSYAFLITWWKSIHSWQWIQHPTVAL